jgi:transaldolase / glucose-6-phosphate isomerase
MSDNPLIRLESFGQSIWLDYIRRGSISSGELKKMIDEDGLTGVTSNPSIFEKAMTGSHDYDSAIRELAEGGHSPAEIFRSLTVEDIQNAADLFRPLYDRLDGQDGFVSLEVSPHLARDTEGTIHEGRALWRAANRPNVMIKVPATPEGIPAIQQLISEGINVNITLLFGLPEYRKVIEAYLAGLEALVTRGRFINRVASVASFFLSRIDVLTDSLLEKIMQSGEPEAQTARELHGEVAVASARAAYKIYLEAFNSQRFQRLVEKGARPQRLLWASTSTKNPNYPDLKYVEALIGPNTVDTMPLETLNAYRDQGDPAPRLTENLEQAQELLARLPRVGIHLEKVVRQLEEEGVEKFNKAFDQLMAGLAEKQQAATQRRLLDRMTLDLDKFGSPVQGRIIKMEQDHFIERMWRKDPGLWKRDPGARQAIQSGLGWLHVAEKMEENLAELEHFTAEIRAAGFQHVLHMGMGGSSLTPLVFARTFPPRRDGLPLTVLDTTDPSTILNYEQRLPLEHTLFIVASKSGTTAEPLAFASYFYDKLKVIKGDAAGENFVAITDPDTALVKTAQEHGYRRVFINYPDIGGRYSALSYFGLLPAALMGLDVGGLMTRALRMQHACSACVQGNDNPGLMLGVALGELALQAHDKVTFLMPPSIASLGLWLEQLLAESTGKEGTGLIPVAGEPVGPSRVYGKDRLFVQYELGSEGDRDLAHIVSDLRTHGQPVIRIHLEDALDIVQEFFRWEFATAVAGSILGINAFDQPNVQESKENTDRLLDAVRQQKTLDQGTPAIEEGPLKFYTPLTGSTGVMTIKQFIDQARPGDYFAIMAYLPERPEVDSLLQVIRAHLRDNLHLATMFGYGPRCLHSTGQLYKGGPDTGLFLQLTADDVPDVLIPGEPYTFGQFRQAQAQGDLEALRLRNRRVLRVHLGKNPDQGLQLLSDYFDEAFQRSGIRNQVASKGG